MTATAPTGEKLYAALHELRQATEISLPRHGGAWRTVVAFLRLEDPRGSDDARQETVINVMRFVRSFEGQSAGEAVRWLRTVYRHRTRDLWRVDVRDPVRGALDGKRSDAERDAPAVERLAAPAPSLAPLAAAALARTTDAVFSRLELRLESDGVSASKRALRRVQARAAWLRLVQEDDAAAIEEALAPERAPSRDALYKWIERGREVLLGVIDAWIVELAGDDPEALLVPQALKEIIGERRADAGVARHERRKH